MNNNLFKAILSMDSYNRGYDAGIQLSDAKDTEIGNAKIDKTSIILGSGLDQSVSFYALSYDWNGQTVISYRGTNTPTESESFWTGDIWNGWFIGGGSTQSKQAELAFKFYQNVVGGVENAFTANVTLVGHSLGGGLSGLVGATYNQPDVTIFDNMPYQRALINTQDRVYSGTPNYDPDLKTLIYGSGSPQDYSINNHKAFSIEGEVLASVRSNPIFIGSTIDETVLSMGDDVRLIGAIPIFSEAVAKHSQASLVIVMSFLDQEFIPDTSAWEPVAKYFWPVLYENGFAQSIGVDQIGGALKDNGDYAVILRTIIAYSAIDEGSLIFGNTGVRSLYDDANDFGKALGKAGVNNAIHTYTTDISKVFVQFAGTLALNEVEESGGWITLFQNVVDGVLTFNSGFITPSNATVGSFDVSFIDPVWKIAGGGDAPKIVARDNIVGGIITDSGDETSLRAQAKQFWGDDSNDVFARVVFGLEGFATARIEDVIGITPDKATLYVGMDGNDKVIGSSGNDLILGGQGDDTILTSGSGTDIIFGGVNTDTFFADFGEDYFDGGSQVDTIDYTVRDQFEILNNGTGNGIRIEADLVKGTVDRSLINGGNKSTDFISNVEKVIGASGDDLFKGKEGVVGQGFTGNGETTERGDKLARTTLVQCTLIAKRYSPYLHAFYEQIKARRGTGKAIIASARKLLNTIFHTLKNNWVFEDFTTFTKLST